MNGNYHCLSFPLWVSIFLMTLRLEGSIPSNIESNKSQSKQNGNSQWQLPKGWELSFKQKQKEPHLIMALVVEELCTFAVIGPGFVVTRGQLPRSVVVTSTVCSPWTAHTRTHKRTRFINRLLVISLYFLMKTHGSLFYEITLTNSQGIVLLLWVKTGLWGVYPQPDSPLWLKS